MIAAITGFVCPTSYLMQRAYAWKAQIGLATWFIRATVCSFYLEYSCEHVHVLGQFHTKTEKSKYIIHVAVVLIC